MFLVVEWVKVALLKTMIVLGEWKKPDKPQTSERYPFFSL